MISPKEDDEQSKLERQREYSRERQKRWRDRMSREKREIELEMGRERQRNRRANLDGAKRQRELQLGRERQRLRRSRMSAEQRDQERAACRLRMRQKRKVQLSTGSSRQSMETDQTLLEDSFNNMGSYSGSKDSDPNNMQVFVDAFLLHGKEKILIGSANFRIKADSTNSILSSQVIAKFQIDPLGFKLESVSVIVGRSELPIVDDRPRKGLHYCFYYSPSSLDNEDESDIDELLEENSSEYPTIEDDSGEPDLLALLGDKILNPKPEPTFDEHETYAEILAPETSNINFPRNERMEEQSVDYDQDISEIFAIPAENVLLPQLLCCDIKDIMLGGDKTLECYIQNLNTQIEFELPVEARRELVRRIAKKLIVNCRKLHYPSKIETRTFLRYLFRDHPNFSLTGFLGTGKKRGFLEDCISHFRRSMGRKGLVHLRPYQSRQQEIDEQGFSGERSMSNESGDYINNY